jgi:hypothetical protein
MLKYTKKFIKESEVPTNTVGSNAIAGVNPPAGPKSKIAMLSRYRKLKSAGK